MSEGAYFADLDAWRGWLSEHYGDTDPVWIRFFKGADAAPSISYEDAVCEALCWGWIDSLIKRVDDTVYVRKFTRRKPASAWSASNRKRVRELIRDGRMQPPGLELVQGVDLDTNPPNPSTAAPAQPPPVFERALAASAAARASFDALPPSHKRRYIGWIMSAKREETRERRSAEAVSMLEQGRRLEGK